MLDKLVEIEAKYERLDQQLQDPSITQDPKAFQEIAKEHGSLKELVTTYREYKQLLQQIEDNKLLLNDDDDELTELAKAELPELEAKQAALDETLKVLLLPKDPNDDKDVIVEIRAGTGGDESALFVADLLRMYQRYCELQGWRLAIMDSSPTGIGGLKEVTVNISGDQVFSTFKYESGTHRVQRVPETESQGRVHTSAVTVAVLAEAEDVDIDIRPEDLEFEAFRASGAGGQHVNTTDSAVRITYKPTGLAVVCREERSQIKNRAKAMKLLKSRLLAEKEAELAASRSANRKAMVGSGDRSEKIRTYNYPQNRVTDHRIGLTLKKLDQVMNGGMEEIVTALRTHYQAELLKEEMSS